jgi:3-hydroxyacyl-[acyl-carrier-protein] dehydratase
MATHELIADPAAINFNRVVADIDAIRNVIPQRGFMEQLTAIVLDDVDQHICVGYKDVGEDEFWASGHMPGMPIMPGVLLCEAAAQVFSYHVQRHDLLGAPMVGFGGLDNVRFRGVARPGDRLVVACQLTKVRRNQATQCRFQILSESSVICDGDIVGVPLPANLLKQAPTDNACCSQ